MNKRGVAGWIVDFFAIGLFILYVVIMLFIFRLSHAGFNNDIQASYEGSAAWVDGRSILNTEVKYYNQNVTFGELLVILGAWDSSVPAYALKYQIQQNLTTIAGRMDIYNVALAAYRGKVPFFQIPDEETYSCEQRSTIAMLPPIDTKDNLGITILLRYCR